MNPSRNLGPCVVIWDPIRPGRPAGVAKNVTFDKTNGGVFFRYEELQAPIKRDQAGLTDVSDVTTGAINPEVELPLSEEEVAVLDVVLANSVVGTNSLRVKNPVGVDVFPLAQQLIVKPIDNGVISPNEDEWLYIHRAFPRVTMEWAYDNAGQRGVKTIFKGYPDDISNRQNEMWRQGPKE